jgi:hypothetical protein
LRRGRRPDPVSLDAFLQSAWNERLEEATRELKADDTQQTLAHGLPLLWALSAHGAERPPSLAELQTSGTDVLMTKDGQPVGILICNEKNMNRLAAKLRKLVRKEHPAARLSNLVMLRDPRLSIPPTAKKTREYLDKLATETPFVRPNVDALLALEALRQLISDARSGDLSAGGDTVAESAVVTWLKTRLDETLRDLIEEIEEGALSPEQALERELTELLLARHLVSLDEASNELESEPSAVRALAERLKDSVGILQGPPAVLFAYIPQGVLVKSEQVAS